MGKSQTDIFNQEYNKLNLQQKQAVDTIEGPVIVIAGAGTGKTQTISLRIAKILLETQINPSNILCLTFTESGVVAMKNRLLSIIGPTAYQVRIHTFHSFCNELVLSDPDKFGIHPASVPASSLEKSEIVRSAIDSLATSSPLKPWGETYYYERDIFSQIQTLKREGVDPDSFLNLLYDHQTSLKKLLPFYDYLKSIRATSKVEPEILNKWSSLSQNNSSIFATLLQRQFDLNQNGFFAKTSDFKTALVTIYEDLTSSLPKLFELHQIYVFYQAKLLELNRYDYDDMILLTQKRLSSDVYYRQTLQELTQYILVDEYQDTNNAQNNIIYSLAFGDQPNIFVVGDDDQSIFRFQGASLENIYAFYRKFSPAVITLKHNYRSQAHILTSADSLISKNQNRITNLIPNLDKSLVSASGYDPTPINIIKCDTLEQEYLWVSQSVRSLLSQKTLPSEIALLTRNNKQAAELSHFLQSQDINYFLENGQDILKDDYILQILHILLTVSSPTPVNISKLYAILAHIQDIFEYTHTKTKSKRLQRIDRKLTWSQKDIALYSPHTAFLKILRRFKKIDTDYKHLVFLKTLSDEFLELSSTRNFSQILDIFYSQIQKNIPLASSIPEEFKKDKVRVMTAHRSKGLEFEHVFILGVQDKTWGNTRDQNKLRLPPGILPLSSNSLNAGDQNEDERRLFYVALTRAKYQAYVSYTGIASVFVAEIAPEVTQNIVPTITHLTSLRSFFQPESTTTVDPNYRQNLADYLKNNYVLTATDINSYLRCPHCFYCEKILRLPTIKSKHVLYGTAIHNALSQYYKQDKISLDDLVSLYKNYLESYKFPNQLDYQESLEKGQKVLESYYPTLSSQIYDSVTVDYNFMRENLHLENVPITGNIDKITYIGKQTIITDFKTGNPDDYTRYPDYKRQLLFYYLLASLSKKFNPKPTNLQIEYTELSKKSGKYLIKEFDITDPELVALCQEIHFVYKKILDLDFGQIGASCKNLNGFHLIK